MSSHDNADRQSESVADAVTAMKLEQDGETSSPTVNGRGAVKKEEGEDESHPNGANPTITTTMADPEVKSRSQSKSPVKKEDDDAIGQDEKVGGDITVRLEPGQPPKLARSTSQKVVPRPPQLFLDLPDSTKEARSTFEVMETCTYANKYMGYTEHAMDCDCAEEWGKLLLPLFCLFFMCLLWWLPCADSKSLKPMISFNAAHFFFLLQNYSFFFFFRIYYSQCFSVSISNHDSQNRRLRKIWHVERTRIVSTAQPRSNVLVIAAAALNAKISDSSEKSMPMWP